jgi:tetratricopeptide (TPR) repeat protein
MSQQNIAKDINSQFSKVTAEEWLLEKVGTAPRNSIGWFRCGVGFYNKKEYLKSIECFEKSVKLDPMNYNSYQVMARACIALNRREEAINALKQSVNLDNPSDWQLLIELTNQSQG